MQDRMINLLKMDVSTISNDINTTVNVTLSYETSLLSVETQTLWTVIKKPLTFT